MGRKKEKTLTNRKIKYKASSFNNTFKIYGKNAKKRKKLTQILMQRAKVRQTTNNAKCFKSSAT